MIISNYSRILLLTACAGLAGCSADSSRFGDFYADALPRTAPAGGVDYTTTASIPPTGVPQPGAPLRDPMADPTVRSVAPVAGRGNPTYYPTGPSTPVTTTSVAARLLTPLASPSTGVGPIRDAIDSNPIPLEPTEAESPPVRSITERVRAALPSRPAPRAIEQRPGARAIVPSGVPALERVTSADTRQDGWSTGQGSTITVREGETLYNLSKRFGIPVASIMAANGISDARSVAAGRSLRIPTYNYSTNAPVSAPDANPDVRAARSATGMLGEPATANVPAPVTRNGSRQFVQPVRTASAQPAPTRASRTAPIPRGGGVEVAPGDTLYRIATRYGTTVSALRAANSLSNDSIRVGQVLAIPSEANPAPVAARNPVQVTATPAVPKASDPIRTASLQPTVQSAPAKAIPVEAQVQPPSLPRTNPQPEPEATASAGSTSGMRWPVRGRVVQNFGGASKGIDIAAPSGTAIRAAEGGKVLYAGSGLKELGKTVLLQHDSGLVTVYGYADDILVAKGQTVARGDVLGSSGMTGSAKTPSVHFQVRKGSTPIDPSGYLN